ncbi:MAG: Wzz/FepE/Etk N-terminal domain-containing protein [Candidatus Magasanikbacteria bacterium]
MFNTHNPLEHLRRRFKLIFLVGFLVALLSVGLTFIFPLEYRADAQVLIISKSNNGIDPYTLVRSAERVGDNVIQVMKTDDFYQKVKAQKNYDIDWTFFENKGEREKRKLWQKTLVPSVVYGTGVLNISTFSTNSDNAVKLAAASADALVSQGWQYVGGDVTMKVVNNPIATRWPVRPNIALNALLGFIVGTLFMGLLVVRK